MACYIFWGFEQVSSTIGWWGVELQSGTEIAAQCMISKYLVHQQWRC